MLILFMLAFLAAVSAHGAPNSANVALDCIEADLSRVGTLCTGQPSTLEMSVYNACSTGSRVTLTFAVDHETIRERSAVEVAPLETLAQHVLLPLPQTVTSGVHTLTVSVKDAAGNVRSTDLDLTVDACDGR
jgi:hypothetical protein